MRKKKGKWRPYGNKIRKPYDVTKDIPEGKDWTKEVERLKKLENNRNK